MSLIDPSSSPEGDQTSCNRMPMKELLIHPLQSQFSVAVDEGRTGEGPRFIGLLINILSGLLSGRKRNIDPGSAWRSHFGHVLKRLGTEHNILMDDR